MTEYYLQGTSLALSCYESAEVSPCIEEADYIRPSNPEEAPEFWSVYLRRADTCFGTGCDCVADMPTKQLATQLADVLNAAILHIKARGITPSGRMTND